MGSGEPTVECIRTTVSLHLPHALFLLLPRVANSIADDLAGQASHFLLARYRSDPTTFNRDSGPVSIKPSFPTALFQVGGFHIQCFEQPWIRPTLTLIERPSIDHGLLRKHLTLHPHHRQLIESHLSPCLPQNSQKIVFYRRGQSLYHFSGMSICMGLIASPVQILSDHLITQ